MEYIEKIWQWNLTLETFGIYILPIILVILFTFLIRKILIENLMIFHQHKHSWSLMTICLSIILSFGIVLVYIKSRNLNINIWNYILNVFVSSSIGGYCWNIISSFNKFVKKKEKQ